MSESLEDLLMRTFPDFVATVFLRLRRLGIALRLEAVARALSMLFLPSVDPRLRDIHLFNLVVGLPEFAGVESKAILLSWRPQEEVVSLAKIESKSVGLLATGGTVGSN